MKRLSEVRESDSLTVFNDTSTLLSEILLTLFPADQSWVLDFSRSFEIHEIQLGDELFHALSGDDGFSIVCQGRVRLVSFDITQQRDVPVALLEAGEGYGADQRFSPDAMPYRAIAASAGLVAKISISTLEPWLQRHPHLQTYLRDRTLAQQRLMFFKVATELRSQSSHTLKRLLPYLTEVEIPAGSGLTQATPTAEGRFWLRIGQIHSQASSANAPPTIGDHWGYPNLVPDDWIATTNLWVYQLAVSHWETVQAILPTLKGEAGNQPQVQPRSQRGVFLSVTPPSHAAPAQLTASHQPLSQTKPAAIEFAKPTRQRKFGQSYPFISQQSSSDCGAACLAMIAQYWGKRFSLNMLRNLAGVGRSGASLKSLALAAEGLGFQSRPVRSSFSRLAEQPSPWIAHWQGDHYIVVYRVRRNRVLVSDPALGRRSLTIPDFQANWTGYALLLNPTELLQAMPSSKPSLGRFVGAFMPYRSMLWSIVLASILLQVFSLVTPLFTQIILDQVVVHRSLPTLQVFIIGLLLFGSWRIGLTYIRQYLLDFFSNQVDLTMISGFISHALNLPLQFFATRHVGDIITRVQENHKIQLFLTRQAVTAWLDAIMAIVYVGLMLHYNWQLALMVLALLPPIIILTVIASPFLRQMSRQVFHESAKQNSTLVEMLTGIATVKATASERELRWQWEDDLTGLFNAQFRAQKLANGLQSLSGLINMLGSTALLWYGATLVIQEQLSIGQFVAFNMMIGSVINPVLSLVGLWDEFQEVLVSVERLDDIFSAQPEESPDRPLLILPRIRGEVQFENLTFRYSADDDRNILQSVSFMANPGDTIALVGRSGSGKSTLANLLQGLYQPTSGRITIDGSPAMIYAMCRRNHYASS